MRRSTLLFLSLFLFKNNDLVSQASGDTAQHVFTLGEVKVKGYRSEPFTTTVSAGENAVFNKLDVSHSLALLPGITLSAVGARNESGVYVRGFDLRQVPVYMDGIPEYVPYDGYVDLGRFTVFDIAEVQLAKGYSSVLYGPNALGGAINLVSRKPVKKMELNAITGWLSGGTKTGISLGSNSRKYYWQFSASGLSRDYFPMSASFHSMKNEDGNRRDNSYSTDTRLSGKIGYAPGKGQEYVIGYVYQHGVKGTPVYTGTDTLNSLYKSPRYWRWPNWDKQTVYLIAHNRIGRYNSIETRIYYDQFKNKLYSYDNATYTMISKPYAFKSIYDDYSLGANATYTNTSFKGNTLSIVLQFKEDVHREHNAGEPVRKMADNNAYLAAEDNYRLTSHLNFMTGAGIMLRNSLSAEGYNSTTHKIFNYDDNNNTAWNLQGGLVYIFSRDRVLDFSVARKTRFATMKDRYSFRMGTAIPNPGLIAENALNYQLGYKDILGRKISLYADVFYSHINNTIQMVNNVTFDTTTHKWLSQQQNTGESEFFGAEASIEYRMVPKINLGLNYTFIRRNNLSNNKIKFTDVPEHKLFAFLQYTAAKKINMVLNAEYNTARYSTSYGTTAGSFATFNGRIQYAIYKCFSVEAGVNNIFDANYSLAEGYPEPGRNYLASVLFNL